ncbi:hypothetical protein KGF54_002713 [Candida jiufengensis]|uniref:uncharacterized protein n=1 Tax=Candida jiufengensis TaxID=497108 RepID=UPI0022257666|nr:uncharacterized protein KGF54_002713 [Candida jiufengensis]KAI5953342.1 hypothetical protein KGF54_002713 [Candida jiufengensis]
MKLNHHITVRKKLLKYLIFVLILINIICIPLFLGKKKILISKLIKFKKNKSKSNKQLYLKQNILKPAPNHKNEYHFGLKGGFSLDDIPKIIKVPNEEPTTTTTITIETSYPKTTKEKIQWLLKDVETNPDHWLTKTEITDNKILINKTEFLPEYWVDKPAIIYDPRLTLSIYLSEIKNQYLQKNPTNDPTKKDNIVIPFAWQDWVDITSLNEELMKPQKQRKTCEYMKQTHHIPTKIHDYCINNIDIMEDELDLMQLPSIDYVPGFAVKKSPTNKATNEVRMLEGKSHLLTYAINPLSIIFLSENGCYEAQINGKQRLVDGNLLKNYLEDNEIDANEDIIELDPINEFKKFINTIKPEEPKIKQHPTEIYIPESAFDYQQDKMDVQIKYYDKRVDELNRVINDELNYDPIKINELRLTRKEKMYYDGIKYANKFNSKKEPTYFRMARLKFNTAENKRDAGWHYEWRFFNGALRIHKPGWNNEELQIRETILLDRILRNWYKFSATKGIISWIAHGPLLAWYWNALLFPFDEDIDIQMPAVELVEFCKKYNQTLVVEDITEGYGKFFIECSTMVHHRSKSYKDNHIDARFIDIDTGSYIDITGLGVSNEVPPSRYDSIIEKNYLQGKTSTIYNCRQSHFYSYDEISPLRFTKLGGVPVYVPNNIEQLLKTEYGEKGLKSYTYGGFVFVDILNLWIPEKQLEFLKKPGQDIIETVQNLTEEDKMWILQRNPDILAEYYITSNSTEFHKLEMINFFNLSFNGTNTKMCDVGEMYSSEEISTNEKFHNLSSTIKYGKPFRKSIFNYEKIDRARHHKD